MEEELHPIEQDDENVAPAVQQVVEERRAAAILQEQEQQQDRPGAQIVYDRLVQFEGILKEAWDEFQEKIEQDLTLLRRDVKSIETTLDYLVRQQRGQEDFRVGESVLDIEARKCGKVKKVTNKFVDIIMDEGKKVVRRKKTNLMKIHSSY